MPTECFVLVGAGGHARVVLDAWLLSHPDLHITIRDDSMDVQVLLGYPVEHPALPFREQNISAHVAIGNNRTRRGLAEELCAHGQVLASVYHPASSCSPYARIGAGCFLAAQAVVAPRSELGMGVIVNHGAIVDHDCKVGAWCHIAPRVVLGGNVTIGEEALIGSGAVILPGVVVGMGAVVGSGAVVTSNVLPGRTVVGVPAK